MQASSQPEETLNTPNPTSHNQPSNQATNQPTNQPTKLNGQGATPCTLLDCAAFDSPKVFHWIAAVQCCADGTFCSRPIHIYAKTGQILGTLFASTEIWCLPVAVTPLRLLGQLSSLPRSGTHILARGSFVRGAKQTGTQSSWTSAKLAPGRRHSDARRTSHPRAQGDAQGASPAPTSAQEKAICRYRTETHPTKCLGA